MSNSAPPSIVLDCSLVADLLLTPSSVNDEVAEVSIWHAPALLPVELLSVLRGHMLAGRLDTERARGALADFEQLGVRFWPVDALLWGRVLALSHNFSAYDATNVALAEALDAPLATRDQRLARAARSLVDVWEV